MMTNHKLLSSCLAAALLSMASVTAVSAQAAEEPRNPPVTAAAAVDDATITSKVKAILLEDPQVQSLSISVTTEKGVVKLSGIVPNAELGNRALQLAAQVPGIKSVESQLKLRPAG